MLRSDIDIKDPQAGETIKNHKGAKNTKEVP
jgi:hypothetical protein